MDHDKIKDFTDLHTWKRGHELVIAIYEMTKNLPKEEVYCLTSQMRRAAISITSNVAEGFGRRGYKEKIHFYYLAHGSLIELKNQLMVAKDVGYINKEKFDSIEEKASETHKLLQGLISASKKFLNLNSSI